MTATIDARTEPNDTAAAGQPVQRPGQGPIRAQAFSPCLIPLLCALPTPAEATATADPPTDHDNAR